MWRRLGIGVLGAFLAAGAARAQASGPTTVILVRHAEKAAEPAADPPLTAAGAARARDLLAIARDKHVGVIITTQFLRTRSTAEPTATALGITPEVVAAAGATHAQDVAEAVKKHLGQTVLVVGHSNTVPGIIEALGAKKPPAICDPEYDNLYIVTIAADGKASVVRSKFGSRSPPDVACAGMR